MSLNAFYLTLFVFLAIYFYGKRYGDKSQLFDKRCDFIENYVFPSRVQTSLEKTYPHLNEEETGKIMQGLRDYFYVCSKANGKMVSMPSQAVDEAWHEFLLFTKAYQNFCQKAFGKFLHHHPAEAMSEPTKAQKGIQLAWKIACHKENISYNAPLRLPLLFAIDATLKIENGFHYTLNCTNIKDNNTSETIYCVSHIITVKTTNGKTKKLIGCGGSAGCSAGCAAGCAAGCGGG